MAHVAGDMEAVIENGRVVAALFWPHAGRTPLRIELDESDDQANGRLVWTGEIRKLLTKV